MLFIKDWTDWSIQSKGLIDLFKQVGFGYSSVSSTPLIFQRSITTKVSDGEKSFMSDVSKRNDVWYYGDIKITHYMSSLGTITNMVRLTNMYSLGLGSVSLGSTVWYECSRSGITAAETIFPAAGVALDRVTLTVKDVFFNDVTSFLTITSGTGGTESCTVGTYFCGYKMLFA